MAPSTPQRAHHADGERRRLARADQDEVEVPRCVACRHGAEFVCARCRAPVCLLHRTGSLGEVCLCRDCSPLAIRVAPLREVAELFALTAVVSGGLIHWLGYCSVGVLAVFLVLVVTGTPLRMVQNQRREAARAAVAAIPPLAMARALPRRMPRRRLPAGAG